jgi:IclR family transcriptional regulator, pca regulon regulatory protein
MTLSNRLRPPPKDPSRAPKLASARYSSSLDRGLAILGCFSGEQPVLGIADLSDQLGMSRSTTHRYASTLVQLGYLEQGPSRRYRLALRGSDLGQTMLDILPLRAQARSHLLELRRKVSYTVSIAILHEDTVRIVDRLHGFRGHARLGVTSGSGCRLPAYCTSLGKTLLANLPDAESRAIVNALTLRTHGPNTITQKHLLSQELMKIRDTGFAIEDEELAAGVLSIAMPVHSQDGVLAAVDISAPTSLIARKDMAEQLRPHLQAATERISTALGDPSDTNQSPEKEQ